MIEDLIYLRKRAGATEARLLDTMSVARLCGHPDAPPGQVWLRFRTAVRSLRDQRGGPALEAAYGFTVTGDDTTDRRQTYARLVGKTPGTLRKWEDLVIPELALRLLSSFYAGAATPEQLVIPHGGLLITDLHTVTIIRDRKFEESEQTRTIISLVDGAVGFTYGTYSSTAVQLLEGIREVRSRSVRGGSLHDLMFPVPLARGQSWTFRFRETVPPDPLLTDQTDPSRPPGVDFAGQTFETPTLGYRDEVCFLGERPEVIWAYDKLTRIERPGEPTPVNSVDMAKSNLSAAVFTELYGGLCSGIAWSWPVT